MFAKLHVLQPAISQKARTDSPNPGSCWQIFKYLIANISHFGRANISSYIYFKDLFLLNKYNCK